MTTLEKRIMASVLLIHTARRLLSPRAIKIYALLISGAGMASLVSLGNVFQNLSLVGLDGVLTFAVSAIVETELIVQVVFAMSIAAAALLFFDILRIRARLPATF